jgi:transposase
MGENLKLETGMTKEDFLNLYKKCKDVRLRERYQAMYLSFSFDWKTIAMIVGRDYETVLSWAHAFNEKGLDGLERWKPPGRTPSLNGQQLNELKETVKCSPRKFGLKFSNWNCKRIAEWIRKRFRIILSKERARQIIHELGFVLIKPSYKFILADKAARKRFLRRLKRVFSNLEKGDVLLFQDEASVNQHPTLKAKWILKGVKEFVSTLGNHAKVSVFGALDHILGKVYHMKFRRMNGKAFIKFVKHLMAIHKGKRIFLVMDNAPWHKSGEVMAFLEGNKKAIKVLWVPTYSPDFNPIEHLWKFMRDIVSHNSFFPTIRELWDVLSQFFKGISTANEKIKSICSPDYLFA